MAKKTTKAKPAKKANKPVKKAATKKAAAKKVSPKKVAKKSRSGKESST